MPQPKPMTRKFLSSALDSTDKAYLKEEFIKQLHGAYQTGAVSLSGGFVVELTERVLRFHPAQNKAAEGYQRRACAFLGDVLRKDEKLRGKSFAVVSQEITELGKGCTAALTWLPLVAPCADQPAGEPLISKLVHLACPLVERPASKTAQEGLVHLARSNSHDAFTVFSCLRERTDELMGKGTDFDDTSLVETTKVWTGLAQPCRDQLSPDDAIRLYHIARDCEPSQPLYLHAFSALTAVCVARNDLYNVVQKVMRADVEQDDDSKRQKKARKIEGKMNTVMVNRMLTTPPTFRTKPKHPDGKIRAMSTYLLSLQG